MFIPTRIIILSVVTIIVVMVAEWSFVSGWSRAMTGHYYHGLCNSGVGRPYQDLTHQLRKLYEAGNTNELGRAIIIADKQSDQIYNVWLEDKTDAYRSSIYEILK